MRFLGKLVLKKDVDKKWMINKINYSMLESTSISDYYEMKNCVSKSIIIEPIIEH